MTKEREYTFEMLATLPCTTIKIRACSLETAEILAEAHYKGQLHYAANNCCLHLITERALPED